MLKAMELAIEWGHEKIVIEGDSLNVINLLKGLADLEWRIKALIKDAYEILKGFEVVQLKHIYREGNKVQASWQIWGSFTEVLSYGGRIFLRIF